MFRTLSDNSLFAATFNMKIHAAAATLIFSAACRMAMAQPPKAVAVFNAAGSATGVAPVSIASAFGKQIGTSTDVAGSLPLSTTLEGLSVSVTDSAKVQRMAPLFYVSPNQINFVVPDGTASGMATVTIMNGDTTEPSTTCRWRRSPQGYSR